jgi:uncharacterized protein YceK
MRQFDRADVRRTGRSVRAVAVLAIAAAVLMAGCGAVSGAADPTEPPVTVAERADGTKELTLSQRAAERLAVETAVVTATSDGAASLSVPYAAVFWDAAGEAWVYAVGAPLTYARAAVHVARIDGDVAFLTDGPPAGTEVVTVGVAELHGVEAGVGGGH